MIVPIDYKCPEGHITEVWEKKGAHPDMVECEECGQPAAKQFPYAKHRAWGSQWYMDNYASKANGQ
jgi:predicted nucleic acid-binding Zn ribbon protein